MNTKEGLKGSGHLSNIIFITGGTKSGKSEFAEHLAKQNRNITYIALSEKRTNDISWEEKVELHKSRRPKEWELIETTDLIGILNLKSGPLLIDSIGGFVMKYINFHEKEWVKKMYSLLELLKKRSSKVYKKF